MICIATKFITEEKVNYPLKTLSQLPLILKGFRKERGLTQAAMAEKLGISQQSYANFEANPARATLDRLFMILRILGVEISLSQIISVASLSRITSDAMRKNVTVVKTSSHKIGKTVSAGIIKKKKLSAVKKPGRIPSITQKRESW